MLGVRDGAGLLAAIGKICAAVAGHRPGTPIDRVLVQPMVAGVGELLIGYRLDRDVGPLVMVAAGGVTTELERDRSLRLAPVDVATAREMLGELRALPLFCGHRGRPAGDLAALAQAIVALSQLADDPTVAEAEINPLIVRATGVVAVDALVKLVISFNQQRPDLVNADANLDRYRPYHKYDLIHRNPRRPLSREQPRCNRSSRFSVKSAIRVTSMLGMIFR